MRHFASMLMAVAKAHPVLFALTIVGVVVLLGGLVWSVIRFVFGALKRVPVLGSAAGATEGAIDKAASLTGSA